MLPVYKRVIFFTVLVAMRDGHLDVFARQVNDRVKWFGSDVLVQQVHQSVFGKELFVVIKNVQSSVQEYIILKQRLNVVVLITVAGKYAQVGHEFNKRTVVLFGWFFMGLLC